MKRKKKNVESGTAARNPQSSKMEGAPNSSRYFADIVKQPPSKKLKKCDAKRRCQSTSDGNVSDVRTRRSSDRLNKKLKTKVDSKSSDFHPLPKKGIGGPVHSAHMTEVGRQDAASSEHNLDSSSDEDSDEWQDVEDITNGELDCEAETANFHKQEGRNEKAVEISIDMPGSSGGKEARVGNKFDWAKHVQWQVNRYNKAFQLQIHKAHLVCLLASALHCSKMCNSTELQARALSLVPIHLFLKDGTFDLNWLADIIKWLKTSFKMTQEDTKDAARPMDGALSRCIEEMSASGERDLTHVCLITVRALGLQARLIQSFQPISIKYTMLSKVASRQRTEKQTSSRGQSSTKAKTSTRSEQGKVKPTKTSRKNKPSQLKEKSRKVKPKTKSVQRGRHKGAASDVSTVTEMSSDSDFERDVKSSVPLKSRRRSARLKRNTTSRQISSSDSEGGSQIPHSERTSCDCWIEVYNPTQQKWMCVDCVGGRINQPDLCERNATKPICYIVAVDNDNSVKDVTKRYDSKWMFETEKLRVQSSWWEDTLKPFSTKLIARDKQEDIQLHNQLQEKPLPATISEYKNHHLYVLKRHLLKFEALYPESATILGYNRGAAVYSRDCVHILHTRETWLKQGLAIKPDEEPYKMVKARPRRNKSYEPLLPLYGKWQTELYIPPPAVDGKVPRNVYGNVELFQLSMLPMGTVHLQIPGLHRTARKLDVDCAPAMIGWDHHGGFCHPVLDGYVVCKEFQEILLDTWEKDQTERENKIKQKREMRVVKNWRSLVNGILIRERLNKRFKKPNRPSTSAEVGKSSWPQNKLNLSSNTLHPQQD